jgi:hypothetical protein
MIWQERLQNATKVEYALNRDRLIAQRVSEARAYDRGHDAISLHETMRVRPACSCWPSQSESAPRLLSGEGAGPDLILQERVQALTKQVLTRPGTGTSKERSVGDQPATSSQNTQARVYAQRSERSASSAGDQPASSSLNVSPGGPMLITIFQNSLEEPLQAALTQAASRPNQGTSLKPSRMLLPFGELHDKEWQPGKQMELQALARPKTPKSPQHRPHYPSRPNTAMSARIPAKNDISRPKSAMAKSISDMSELWKEDIAYYSFLRLEGTPGGQCSIFRVFVLV